MTARLTILKSPHAGLVAGRTYPIIREMSGGWVVDDNGQQIWVGPREGKIVENETEQPASVA